MASSSFASQGRQGGAGAGRGGGGEIRGDGERDS
jgi:hypothetical protein